MSRLRPPEDLGCITVAPDDWDSDDISGSIERLYTRVEARAHEVAAWYLREKRNKGRLSRSLRALTIALFGLGALSPLLAGVLGKGTSASADLGLKWSELGYVAIAVGAGLLAFDRYFGVSTSYVRYLTAGLAVEKALSQFHLDWTMLVANVGGLKHVQDTGPLVARIATFGLVIEQLVESETNAWVGEFQSNLAALRQAGKIHAEALEPGVIDLTLSNGMDADGAIEVSVDGVVRETIRSTRCQIGRISPGEHRVAARAVIAGKSCEASTGIVLAPAATVTLTLGLR